MGAVFCAGDTPGVRRGKWTLSPVYPRMVSDDAGKGGRRWGRKVRTKITHCAWTVPLPEITVREEGVAELAGGLVCEPVEFTAHFKTPKRWRCGSRKRFIKLLMSEGISRNQAGSVARVARIAGVPYGELWRDYFFWG